MEHHCAIILSLSTTKPPLPHHRGARDVAKWSEAPETSIWLFSVRSRATYKPLLVLCKGPSTSKHPANYRWRAYATKWAQMITFLPSRGGACPSDVTHHTPPPGYYRWRPPSCLSVWFDCGGVVWICVSVSGRRAGSFVWVWPGGSVPGLPAIFPGQSAVAARALDSVPAPGKDRARVTPLSPHRVPSLSPRPNRVPGIRRCPIDGQLFPEGQRERDRWGPGWRGSAGTEGRLRRGPGRSAGGRAAGNPMPRPLRSGGPMPRPRRNRERRGSAPIGGRKRPHDGRRPGVNGPASQSWPSEFPWGRAGSSPPRVPQCHHHSSPRVRDPGLLSLRAWIWSKRIAGMG